MTNLNSEPGARCLLRRGPGLFPIHHRATDDVIGYSIVGALAGPRALSVGVKRFSGDAFHRLAQLESLMHLRGQLILVFEEALFDDSSGVSVEDLYDRPIDGSIYIAFGSDVMVGADTKKRVQYEAYWSILRLCANLGMIAGRGVPVTHNEDLQPRIFRYHAMAR